MFFKIHHSSFPKLSEFAKNILCIPITSVPVESLFSECGNTATDFRSKLTPTNLYNCIFYKTNKRFFFKEILF